MAQVRIRKTETLTARKPAITLAVVALVGVGVGLFLIASRLEHVAEAPTGSGQEPARTQLHAPAAFPAPLGEKLVYSVSWLGVRAGTIELETLACQSCEGSDCITVGMAMRSTNAVVEAIYPVRECARSYVDAVGTFSRRYEVERLQRKGPVKEIQTFDYARNISVCTTERRGKLDQVELELDGPAQDPISWLYYVRACIAAGGRSARFWMVQRDKRWLVELSIDGLEELDVGPLGHVRALKATGGAGLGGMFGRSPEETREVALWFDESSGILILAKAEAPVGHMSMQLVERRTPGP